MEYFEYGQKELAHLAKHDKKLGEAIEQIGFITRETSPDVFPALIRNIVGQQISTVAARTVWGKLVELFGEVTPQKIRYTDVEDIQKCGMSMRKAQYIKGAADSEIDFAALDTLSDAEVIELLSSLHGVGVWTAEMLLMFSLSRTDVVSYNDLGIRRGMMRLYGLKELGREQFAKYAKRYSPYGTVASLYLWELAKEVK